MRTRFEALLSSGRMEGAGVLADISHTGALIEEASYQPEIDKDLRLFIFVQPVSPYEVRCRVVRHTGSGGFAVRWESESDELRRLVDDAAALVGVPAQRS